MAPQKTKKNDFIELEFTAKTKTGEIFDTTNFEEAKKSGMVDEKAKEQFKPIKLCIGQGQVLKALDKQLEDKEPGKDYEIEISPKEGYGNRDSKLIRTVPLTAFQEMPQRGMFVNVNGMVAKVISVAGGRVLIDMNHPLAGKETIYRFKILRIVDGKEEKIQIFLESLGLKKESYSLEQDKNKAVIKEKVPEKIQEEMKKRAKEILQIELEFKEEKDKKEKDITNKE